LQEQYVESLTYQVKYSELITYADPPPLDVDAGTWTGRLENMMLTCQLKARHRSVDDARREVESYLHAWEIDAGIRQGRGSMGFVYKSASTINLPPSDGASTGIPAAVSEKFRVNVTYTLDITPVTLRSYPSPPEGFKVSPDVETLWMRYEGYSDGKEPLETMGYFCLTLIEQMYGYGNGKRETAARTLNVESEVFERLGELTSTRGSMTTARKAPQQGQWQPLTGAERRWIEAVVGRLILRLGEYAGRDDPDTLVKVGMKDFPPLQ
jgi:hypothetical protein